MIIRSSFAKLIVTCLTVKGSGFSIPCGPSEFSWKRKSSHKRCTHDALSRFLGGGLSGRLSNQVSESPCESCTGSTTSVKMLVVLWVDHVGAKPPPKCFMKAIFASFIYF